MTRELTIHHLDVLYVKNAAGKPVGILVNLPGGWAAYDLDAAVTIHPDPKVSAEAAFGSGGVRYKEVT